MDCSPASLLCPQDSPGRCSRIWGWGRGQGPMGQAGWSPEVLATLRHLPSPFVMTRVQEPSGWGEGQVQWAEQRLKGSAHGHQHTSSRDSFTVKPTAKRPWKNHRSDGKSWSKRGHHVRHLRLSRWEDRPLGSGAPRLAQSRIRPFSLWLLPFAPWPRPFSPWPLTLHIVAPPLLTVAPPLLTMAPPPTLGLGCLVVGNPEKPWWPRAVWREPQETSKQRWLLRYPLPDTHAQSCLKLHRQVKCAHESQDGPGAPEGLQDPMSVGFRTTLGRDTPSPCPLRGVGWSRGVAEQGPLPQMGYRGNVFLCGAGGGTSVMTTVSLQAQLWLFPSERERGLAPTHSRGGHIVEWLWGVGPWVGSKGSDQWQMWPRSFPGETRQPESLQAASWRTQHLPRVLSLYLSVLWGLKGPQLVSDLVREAGQSLECLCRWGLTTALSSVFYSATSSFLISFSSVMTVVTFAIALFLIWGVGWGLFW